MRVDKNGRLEFFKELYEEARAAMDSSFEKIEKSFKQYLGDPTIDPLPGDTSMPMQASVVRNITYELIESQITTYIPTPKCDPMDCSEWNDRCAMSVEQYLRSVRNQLPMEEINDQDERNTYVFGGSIFLVEWDESQKTHRSVGGIKVSVLSPRRFVGQPYIWNIDDMEYCFAEFETTREDLCRKYGVSYEKTEDTSNDQSGDDDTATMYVCYYKDDDDRICQFIWSGDVVLRDEENFYGRKRKYCTKCGKRSELCSCEKPKYEKQDEEYEELERDIVLSDGETVIPAESPVLDEYGNPVMEEIEETLTDEFGEPLYSYDEKSGLTLPIKEIRQAVKTQPTRLPFYTPKSFPIVIRKNTSKDESVLGQSDCEFIRSQQQAINKVESRIMEKLMRAGITPVIPEDASVTLNNSIFGQVIRLRPGESMAQYGVIDTQAEIARDVMEADRLYDQAKRVLGISESFQGHHDSSAKSGIAKQTQAMQSSGRLDSKRKMKNAAWARMDRIMFELLLAFADEPRPAAYKDAFGKVQQVTFNRYDFLRLDEETNEWYYDDSFLFSTDASADVNTDRVTLWNENLANFERGAYGDPAQPETQYIYWLNQQKAHYPFAQDNVERVRRIVEENKAKQELEQRINDSQATIDQLIAERDAALARSAELEKIAGSQDAELREIEEKSIIEEEIRKINKEDAGNGI